jgi:hypothetical protein
LRGCPVDAGLGARLGQRLPRDQGRERGWEGKKMNGNSLASALGQVVSRGHRDSTVVSALALAAVLNCVATTALAGNTYVVTTALDPTGPPNTTSLREAIVAANAANSADGNTVQFDPSLAGSTITLTTGEIQINHQMHIVGPGAGNLTISGADASRIFYLSCADTTQRVSISGLSLRNGNSANYGGAIASKRCYLILDGANINASHAKAGGGVFFNNGRIVRTVVSGCSAQTAGGILEYKAEGPVSIEYSTISSNHASYSGGGVGIFFVLSSVINRSTINNNFVPSPGTSGPLGGGGIEVTNAKLKVAFSTITGNHSFKSGGGISFADFDAANYATVYRSTITSNYSYATPGNGLYAAAGHPTVSASIVADNFNIYGLTDLSGSFTLLYSLVQTPGNATISGSGSILGIDAHLGPLAVNGGPTRTRLPYAASLAVDALPGCGSPGVDQRGVSACVNGKMDIGAVERQSPEVIIFRDGFDSG